MFFYTTIKATDLKPGQEFNLSLKDPDNAKDRQTIATSGAVFTKYARGIVHYHWGWRKEESSIVAEDYELTITKIVDNETVEETLYIVKALLETRSYKTALDKITKLMTP